MSNNGILKCSFKCYFCNKTIKNETEMGHTTVCGSVLLPCPNSCGSYIRRMDLFKHNSECLNGRNPRKILSESESSETDISSRSKSSTDILQSNAKNNFTPQILRVTEKPFYVENSFYSNSLPKHDIQTYKEILGRQSQDIYLLKRWNNDVLDWKKDIMQRLAGLQNQVSSQESTLRRNNVDLMINQEKMSHLDKIQVDMNIIRDRIEKDENFSRKCASDYATQLMEFKQFIQQEIAVLKSMYDEQTSQHFAFQKNFKDINDEIAEIKNKFSNIVFDMRAVSQISSEVAEKVDSQNAQIAEFRRQLKQIRFDVESVEQLPSSNGMNFGNLAGRLLWKINDFDSKMETAKTQESVIKSPIFYTHEYGYKIRVCVYFNGLKKWKDRYTLICLNVLKGEFDTLLKWPCNIEGYVTLRDVERNSDQVKDFQKKITAKTQSGNEDNEDPQESSSSFIFIPHTTITKSKYVQDDSIFLDIKIENNNL